MSKTAVTVHDVSADDMPQLLKMHAKSWRDTYPNEAAGVPREWVEERTAKWLTPENIEKRQRDAFAVLADPDKLWKVAKDDSGTILGLIRASRGDGKQYFGALYVDKAHHGKDVAQALMDEFLKWEDPSQPTTLDVATYNDRAKAFYRKYEFEEVPGTERLHHEVIPIVTMVRKSKR